MAYCNNDNEAAELVAQKLGSYPDTCWDNVDRLVRRMLAMIGYRPVKTKPLVLKVVEILKQQGKFNDWGDPSSILDEESEQLDELHLELRGDPEVHSLRNERFARRLFNQHREFQAINMLRASKIVTRAYGEDCTTADRNDILNRFVAMLKSHGKFLAETTKHREVMDNHFKRARAYLYGFPTATQDVKNDTDDAGSTTTVMPALDSSVAEEETDLSMDDNFGDSTNIAMDEASLLPMSDALASEKIADKLMGIPDLTFVKIRQMIPQYLSMVGKPITDAQYLAVLVFDRLQELELAEESDAIDPDMMGLMAFRNGAPLSQCPYDADFETDQYAAWVNGWRTGAMEADAAYTDSLYETDPLAQDEDQAYLDQREADYVADAGPGLVKSEFVSYGHKFDTYVFDDIDAANAFMSENSGWGAIGEDADGKVHVARMDDDGQSVGMSENILDTGDVDEAQDAIIHIPRDQDKSFKDEVLVGGTDGPEQDMNYIKRMRALAGLK